MEYSRERIEQKLLELLQEYDFPLIYLLGSLVNGHFNEESDLDIAVYGDIDYKEKFVVIDKIEEEFKRKIDFIILNEVDENFRAEIIATGKCIYAASEDLLQQYEMKILAAYLTLEEDRRIVIDEIYRRKSILLW